MPGPVFQSGARVSLHTVEEQDLDLYARAHADPDIRVPLTIDDVQNRDGLEELFEEDISDDDNVHLLATVDHETATTVADEVSVARLLDLTSEDEESDGSGAVTDESEADEDRRVPVGAVIFISVDESAGTASLAYWILPEFQGEGFGSEAVDLLLEYGFDELRLHRVQAHSLATNEGSIGLLESLGFEPEGRSRERQYLDGEYVDVLRYGLLEDEWRGA
jgi:RimJ/RimL family protein N-acetyltransferase